MASRRKRTLLQADPSAISDFAVSINQAFPAVSSASSSRSATPVGGGSVERFSDDRRRVRREAFAVPSPSTAGTPDNGDAALPGTDDVFAPIDADGLPTDGEAGAQVEGEGLMRAKRYMTSVSTIYPASIT